MRRCRDRVAIAVALGAVFALAPDAALAGTAASITAIEGQQLTNVVVDSFAPCNPATLQSISIDWGDGTTSSGASFEQGNGCGITGTHTYAEEGSYITEVSYAFASGGMGKDAGAATVGDAAVGVSGVSDLTLAAGSPFSGVVGHWMDVAPAEPTASYSAAVDWGDGQAGAGAVGPGGDVTASHAYTYGGRYPIAVTFRDEGGSSAVAHEHAIVSGCPTQAPSTPSPAFDPPATGLNDRFVQALYHDALGRAPTQSQLGFATNALGSGTTRAALALSILASNEYRGGLVAAAYARYLGRAPSASETAALGAALAGGASDEALGAQILGSSEYVGDRGGNSPDGFLGALYCDAVFRAIDVVAQNNDDAALGSGTQSSAIASGVLGSTEYLALTVNGDYLHYLRRAGDSSELLAGAGSIKGGGSDEKLIAALLASTEYYDSVNPKVAIVSSLRVQGHTLSTTLDRAATLKLTVLRALPHGRSAAATLPAARARLVGVVPLGSHHRGRVRLHWNRRVHRKRLKHGTYLLILKAYRGRKLIGVTDAARLTVR